ncbi:DUF2968 domain-containing protein [Glaciimonas sp. GNP009]|uniref:DUF2968 domain-containing protein n=1 Tax=unclassified Glaciimonas TaxID=2644401 RepID=UPI002B222FCE|nr:MULTISPECIES: DUF2968 domain-containing protein [unclassified Glaciimonas]MEB0013058.1 DUF2968 domain-containing protein [Glaciimonas sp. Cout2]
MNLNVCEVMGRCVGGAASGLSIVAVIAALSTNVMAQSASRPQGATTSPNTMTSAAGSTAAAPTIDTANSTIGELQQLMQGQGISELRTTYNGNYGSSLLFKSDNRTYYVALFQQKNFWRVVKTTSEVQAEQTYKSFVGQTEKLAEVDIRRIKLEADKQYTEQLISGQENRLLALQNDLAVQRQQEKTVSAQQDQARQQALALNNKQQTARNELMVLRNRIRALEAQQTVIDGGNMANEKSDAKSGKK